MKMWNYKKTNRILIFLVLIGFSAVCYGAQDVSTETNKDLVEKNQSTIMKSKLIINPSDLKFLTDYNVNDDDIENKKHEITTTTTNATGKIENFALENEEDLEKKKKTTTTSTPAPTTTTSTPAPTTTTPTPAPTTSTPAPTTTTSTPAPMTTTSTPAPTTTTPTPAPTTSSSTTTTTTTEKPPPTTTTTTTTSTTPKPNPHPKPDIGLWNCSCIRLQMAAELNFTYPTKDNKTAWALTTVPSKAKLHDHDCTEKAEIQQMALEWGSEELPNSLTLHFEKNGTEYGLYMLLFKIQSSELPNAKENISVQLVYMKNTFLTPLQMSYHCTREQKLNLTSTLNHSEIVGDVKLTNLQFEAFHNGSEIIKFSTAKDCDAIDTPDIVPIAVGIALIALILIVLISYLVARRRSMARGYMSF